ADDIIASAKKEKDEIIDKAEVKGKKIRNSIDDEKKKIMEKAAENARKDALSEIRKMEQSYDKILQEVKKQAKEGKKEALKKMHKRIFE
ncbi:MAG: hypothetical protein SVK54_03110, partial [candidate division WOR-3 bacterium]|nr:hypothetical protein [candidate division WOR-3 bacterium]